MSTTPDLDWFISEEYRKAALHTIQNINTDLYIIGNRLARIGPSRIVPPQAADADGLVRQVAALREQLAWIEQLEARPCPDCGAGCVADGAYVPHNSKCPAVAS